MERLRAQARAHFSLLACDRVTEIVSRYLKDLILPYVYAEARVGVSTARWPGRHIVARGHEVVVSDRRNCSARSR